MNKTMQNKILPVASYWGTGMILWYDFIDTGGIIDSAEQSDYISIPSMIPDQISL